MSFMLSTNIIVNGSFVFMATGLDSMSEKTKTSKVTLSLESDALLDKMIERTNDGFTGGRLTKHEGLSWIVRYFYENQFDRTLDRIRGDHFDRVAHVENLIKRIKRARHQGAQDDDAELQLRSMVDGTEKSRERQPRLAKVRESASPESGSSKPTE